MKLLVTNIKRMLEKKNEIAKKRMKATDVLLTRESMMFLGRVEDSEGMVGLFLFRQQFLQKKISVISVIKGAYYALRCGQ